MKGLQEQFLANLCKAGIPATFYLLNGYQMKGKIIAFDDYTMMIDGGSGCQLVFKHAISTVMPHHHMDLEIE